MYSTKIYVCMWCERYILSFQINNFYILSPYVGYNAFSLLYQFVQIVAFYQKFCLHVLR